MVGACVAASTAATAGNFGSLTRLLSSTGRFVVKSLQPIQTTVSDILFEAGGKLPLEILASQGLQKAVEVVEEWLRDFARQRLTDGVLGSVCRSGSPRNPPQLGYAGVTELVRDLGQELDPAGDASFT